MNYLKAISIKMFYVLGIITVPVLALAQTGQVIVFQGSPQVNPMYSEYKTVGAYQVKGNPYVLAGANISTVYTNKGYANNTQLVYDANTQQVSVLQQDRSKVIDLKSDELDSFVVRRDDDKRFKDSAFFINARRFDNSQKGYMQRLTIGPKFNLYKMYKVELRQSSNDIVQTSLREFEIVNEYYYMDMSAKNDLVKVKNLKSLKKDFENNTAALAELDKEYPDMESKYIIFFQKLNQ